MKTLNITPISNTSQFPVKRGTLQFLQDAYTQITSATIEALIGPAYDPTVVYILSGCVNSGALPAFNISAGVAYYGGEVYSIDAAAFTPGGTNIPVFSISQTQYTIDADPVTFTDNTVRNVHDIRKLSISQGAPGSGISNYAQAFFLNFTIPKQVNITASGAATVTGAYPNLNINVPTVGLSNEILFAGSYNIGDPVIGGYTVPFGITLPTASYYVMGSIISNGTPSLDCTLTWSIHNRLSTSFGLNIGESQLVVQNVAFEYIIFAK